MVNEEIEVITQFMWRAMAFVSWIIGLVLFALLEGEP